MTTLEHTLEKPASSDGAMKRKSSDDFEKACEKTREALRALADHWQEAAAPLAAAARALAEDPAGFTREGYDWSCEVGLAFVLPAEALQCRPSAKLVARDGLRASSAGGTVDTHPGLIVAPSPPCGFGVFATCSLPVATKLGEYTGEVRSYDVWLEEIKAHKVRARGSDASVPFIREELYSAWTGEGPAGKGVVVDAFAVGNAMRFVNCSCSPCCGFKGFGKGPEKHSRMALVTNREVAAWEQLSADYGWWFDDATRQDVRQQAVEVYTQDRAALEALGCWLHTGEKAEATEPSGPCPLLPWVTPAAALECLSRALGKPEVLSEVLRAVAEAIAEARGPPSGPASDSVSVRFLRRFVDPEEAARFLERGEVLPAVRDFLQIPDAVWPLCEVVGAERVGIPCRCGLDASLNAGSRCSGIIGRPLQAVCNGREDLECEWQ